MEEKTLFSAISQKYARHRLEYPLDLAAWLVSQVDECGLLWDCGTGTGQVAGLLSPFFKKVIATDISSNQLANAIVKNNITYIQSSAEKIDLPDKSVNLITVACAAHWFDLNKFYQEVTRVLTPNGRLAIWSYTWPTTQDSLIEEKLLYIKDILLGPYWCDGARLHLNQYKDLAFPFMPISAPTFVIQCKWELQQLIGFLETWSTIQYYINEVDNGFISKIQELLGKDFPEDGVTFNFPLYLKLGKLPLQ